MNKKKIITSDTKQIINHETGEIIESESLKSYVIEKEPDFIKMYISDISRLKELPKGMTPILVSLIRNMNYNNVIVAYMPIKKMACRELGISVNYLNKAIDAFYKKGILIRLAKGIYMADPELFAKGTWTDIRELRLVIEYNQNGTKQLKSNLPEQMKLKLGM
jgi:hypothetical protein